MIAPLVVWRRGDEDYLLLTEPELGETVRAHLARMRLRARCEIEPEEHASVLVFGGEGIATDFPGAAEVLDSALEPTLAEDELELRRIEAGVPRWGREIDDRVLPAEAGLDATHVSFTKGCYPGQEPVARLHYRGHVEPRSRARGRGRSTTPSSSRGRARDERGAPPRRHRRRARVRARRGAGGLELRRA